MFVSHQWISDCHPDPHYQQLKVLQDALRNLLSGKVPLKPHFFDSIFDTRNDAKIEKGCCKDVLKQIKINVLQLKYIILYNYSIFLVNRFAYINKK